MKLTAFNKQLVLKILGVEHGWSVSEVEAPNGENLYLKRGNYDLLLSFSARGTLRWYLASHKASDLPMSSTSSADRFDDAIKYLQRFGNLT